MSHYSRSKRLSRAMGYMGTTKGSKALRMQHRASELGIQQWMHNELRASGTMDSQVVAQASYNRRLESKRNKA